MVDNAPVLFPDGSYMKKGDTIVRKEIREDVALLAPWQIDPFELGPVARGPDIAKDG